MFELQETNGEYSVKGTGSFDELVNVMGNQAKRFLVDKVAFTNPDEVRNYILPLMMGLEREEFWMILLDTKHHVIEIEVLFYGSINSASVYPREVVKTALKHNAAAVVLCHNHPSGDAAASSADKNMTTRIKNALSTVEIDTLDHLVYGTGSFYSFAEHNLI